MQPFDLRRPTSIDAAAEELAAGGVPYWGGTELFSVMRMGLMAADVLVDLKRIPELRGIGADGDDLVIRAGARHAEVAGSTAVRESAAVLVTATEQLGNARVRATGTLAGNICFAEPRSDVAAVLVALDAGVDLRSAQGARTLSVDDFLQGAFTTARQPDELLVAIRIPRQRSAGAYLRFQPAEYPTVTVAAVRTAAAGGWRIVVGAVGERPQLFDYPSLDDVDAAGISGSVDVIADLNGSEDYKRHVTGVFVRRAVSAAREAQP